MIKMIWIKGSKEPTAMEIEKHCERANGKFAGLSPSLFEGWNLWIHRERIGRKKKGRAAR